MRSQCADNAAAAAEQLAEAEQPEHAEQPGTARFWSAVCLVLRQFDGLKAGYRARRVALGLADADDNVAKGGGVGRMSDWDFLFLESNGDLYDVIDWQQPDQRPSWVQGAE